MTRDGTKASNAAIWAALVTVYVVWGSTYLAIRVVVQAGIPPLLGMGTRFLAAAVILLGFLAGRGGFRSLAVTRRELAAAAVVGTLLLLGGNGLVAVAEKTVPSGLAALIVGAVPLWFVLLRVAGGERPRRLTWLGVMVGFAGVAAISLPRGGIDGVAGLGHTRRPRGDCVLGVRLVPVAATTASSGRHAGDGLRDACGRSNHDGGRSRRR